MLIIYRLSALPASLISVLLLVLGPITRILLTFFFISAHRTVSLLSMDRLDLRLIRRRVALEPEDRLWDRVIYWGISK